MGCQSRHTDRMFPQTLCLQHPDHSPEACTSNHVFKNKLISSLTCSTSSWLLGGSEDPRATVYPSLPFTPYPSPGLLRSLPPHHLSHPSPPPRCIPTANAPVQASSSLLGYHNSCLTGLPANSVFTFAPAARVSFLKHLLDHSTSFLSTPHRLPAHRTQSPVLSRDGRYRTWSQTPFPPATPSGPMDSSCLS